jgi:fructose-bisphosphate aldolase, class I
VDKIKTILDYYENDNAGVKTNLARMLNHGKLAKTGKMIILPVDQGFEHGPVRSFAANPDAYHPHYHFKLAIDAGLNAYAAPVGWLEAGAATFAGQIPLILKLNSANSLYPNNPNNPPFQAITGTVADALRLGCVGVGFTIYPGSSTSYTMIEQIRAISEQAKAHGLVVVIWSYPRGEALDKAGETALDVCAYAAHIAALLGAHIIKVKLPEAHIAQNEALKSYESAGLVFQNLAERVAHIKQTTFAGRRLVIFSGGAAKYETDVLNDTQAISEGGGDGSIIGRNAFQRPRAEAMALLEKMVNIYKK